MCINNNGSLTPLLRSVTLMKLRSGSDGRQNNMSIRVGRGRYRVEIELWGSGVFMRLPLVGEVAMNRLDPFLWSRWNEVKAT